MRENRSIAMQLRRSNLSWSVRPRHGEGEGSSLRYVQIGELADARMQIGLSEDGDWVRIGQASVAVYRAGSPIFLPVLIMRFSEVRRILLKGIRSIGVSKAIEEIFPFEQLVTVGMGSGSEYWVRFALDRVLELPPSMTLLAALIDSSERAPTQQLRHRSKKMAAQMNRKLPRPH